MEKFCFAGAKNTYYLSPYFNCFIGGRGSGKSTILNLLGQYSKDATSSEEFWQKIQPSFDTKDSNFFSFEGVELFEFIGQNEVESFATNTETFTNAIYERSNLLNDEILSVHEKKLAELLDTITSFKQLVEDINELLREKDLKEKDKKIFEGSIKLTQSSEYTEIVKNIQEKSHKKQELERWRTNIDELRKDVNRLYEDHFSITAEENDENANNEQEKENITNDYQAAFKKVKVDIESAIRTLSESNFNKLKEDELMISQGITDHEEELSKLLKDVGLSDENILQVKSSPQKVIKLHDELLKINEKIKARKTELSNYNNVIEEVKSVKIEYEKSIRESIEPLIATLKNQARENNNADVKNIGLNYFFDEQLAWDEIANDFYLYFSEKYKETEKAAHVKEYITSKKESFNSDYNTLKEMFSSESKEKEYIKFLKNVFSENSNFQIFETIRDKHLNDVTKYKRIEVLYDGKNIEQASFGQKCTAVMVILLLFGNYPLVIDEPEAHLDSSLIANYLVPLIKQKKSNRQIIFATHNANFVINGDAEKIFILKNETGITEIIETTIEDLKNRNELLKLEGGREAFRKRGEKLHI